MKKFEVLKCLQLGYSRKEISVQLGIHIHVVDYHCRNLLQEGYIKRKVPPKCIYDVTAKGKGWLSSEDLQLEDWADENT